MNSLVLRCSNCNSVEMQSLPDKYDDAILEDYKKEATGSLRNSHYGTCEHNHIEFEVIDGDS